MTDHSDVPKPLAPMVLGYTPMDDVHVEFVEVVQQATDCADADFPARLDAVVAHLKHHFEQEDRWRDETGVPPGDCHRDEHAKVLASAAEVQALEPAQLIEVGREFIKALVDWFPNHADYLDSALAAWMCKRAFGGKPVVLHRRGARQVDG